jgi:hypothetical protein
MGCTRKLSVILVLAVKALSRLLTARNTDRKTKPMKRRAESRISLNELDQCHPTTASTVAGVTM